MLFAVYSKSQSFRVEMKTTTATWKKLAGLKLLIGVALLELNSELQLDSIPFSFLETFHKCITCRSVCVKLRSISFFC